VTSLYPNGSYNKQEQVQRLSNTVRGYKNGIIMIIFLPTNLLNSISSSFLITKILDSKIQFQSRGLPFEEEVIDMFAEKFPSRSFNIY
jgi:hypothetical protein